jgi:hypothetical protein
VVGVVQTGLDGRPLSVDQTLHPHADQPDPGPLQTEGVEESGRGGIDLAGHVGGVAQGAAAGDRREVREAHLEGDGAPEKPGGADPSGRAVGQPEQLSVDERGVVDVGGEGLVRADAFLALLGHDPPCIAPPGQVMQLGAGGVAERPAQGVQRGVGEVGDGVQA